MPFFVVQLPLLLKRPEAEFHELRQEKQARADDAARRSVRLGGLGPRQFDEPAKAHSESTKSESKKAQSESKASVGDGDELDARRFYANPVLNKVRLMLETHPAVASLSWIEQGREALLLFAVTGDAAAERIMKDLGGYGVGHEFGSLSLFNLQAQFPKAQLDEKEQTFRETIKSRVMVENVVQQTKAQAVFSFDFLALCVVASILAAVGLAIDSAVVVVASMLVSPIMGPILAVTFGSVVHDWKLVKVGVLSELLSLLICVFCGFLVGLCFAPYGPFFSWPTPEMAGRGTSTGLIVGLAIALPSGIGVALSVLGNNTSSLVGVAISASLLPPAVNCGMCYAYALVGGTLHADVDAVQYINIGSISFLLTILNIACVYAAAYGMYKVKEVVPLPGKTHFWTKDVAAARHADALAPDEAEQLRDELRRALNQQRNARTMAAANLSDLTMAAVPSSLSALTWHPYNVEEADDEFDNPFGKGGGGATELGTKTWNEPPPANSGAADDNEVALAPSDKRRERRASFDARAHGGGKHVSFHATDSNKLLTPRNSTASTVNDAVDIEMPREMAAMFAPPETPNKEDHDKPPESLQSLFQPLSPRSDDPPPSSNTAPIPMASLSDDAADAAPRRERRKKKKRRH